MTALIFSNFLFQYKEVREGYEVSNQENVGPRSTPTGKGSVFTNKTNMY